MFLIDGKRFIFMLKGLIFIQILIQFSKKPAIPISKQEVLWTDTLSQSSQKSVLNARLVVPLLYSKEQSWKSEHASGILDSGEWLMSEELRNVPLSIMSMDDLFDNPAKKPERIEMFLPEDAYLGLSDNGRPVEFIPVTNGQKAQECPGYLTFIIHNYDRLPDVSIFLHGTGGHNPTLLEDIRHVLENWTPEQIGFLHLNTGFKCGKGVPWQSDWNWAVSWKVLGFQSEIPPWRVPCCAQFMVTRERIQLRSRWFYQQLLKLSYHVNKCAFQEHYWHVFFGEHAFLPEERSVQFYKTTSGDWKPPIGAVLKNPYPNVPYSSSMEPWYKKSISDPGYYDMESNDTKCM